MANVNWQQITSAPEWESLDGGQRDAVRQKFFSDVIQPNIPDGTDPSGIQKDFYARTQGGMTPDGGFGLGNIGRGIARGALRAGRGLIAAGEGARELMNPFEPDSVRSAYQDQNFGAGDKLRDVEQTIPGARTTGAKIAQGLGGFGAGILTAGAGEPGAAGQDVINRGGSVGRAVADTAISGAGNELGLLTGRLGGGIGSRLALQSTAGGAISEGSRRAENAISSPDEQRGFDPVEFGLGAGGAALGAFAHSGARAPLKAGDDLFGSAPVPEPVRDTSGAPTDQVFTRGYQVMRDGRGVPFGISRGDGNVVQLNGRNVNDVIDSMQQIVPRGGAPDQPGVNLGGGPVESNVVDSTATDVTPKKLTGPRLALPKPSDFEVDSTGQAVPTGESAARNERAWTQVDPRENPQEFGIKPLPKKPTEEQTKEFETAVQQIELQQAHADAHNTVADQSGVSPQLLDSETQAARETNAADPSLGQPSDAPADAAHAHLEDLALHAGVDPHDLHQELFSAKNDADYAKRVAALIKEKSDAAQQAALPETAAVDSAPRVGEEPGNNGGAQGVVTDAGGPNGAGEPVGRPAAGGVSGGSAPEAVASRGGATPARGMGAAQVRAAITQRFGSAGRRLVESGKVQIHDSADTFPESGQHLRSDDAVLRGIHDTSTGITHIAADSVTEHNVNGVVLHEVGLHDGLRKVIGDRIEQLAAQLHVIGKTGKPAERAIIEAANRNASLEHHGVRAEELVAHTIEHAEAAHASGTLTPRMTTWLADLVSHVKAGLFRMGVIGAHKLGLNDIRMLAEGALRRVSREPLENGAVSDHLDAHRNRASRIAALNDRRVAGGLSKADSEELHNLRDQHDLHNPLSGLPNKKAFEHATASGEYSHAAALDVDEFKKFNDNFGHGAGDVLLQYVARKLGGAGDENTKVFHLSGDEYAVASKGDPTESMSRAQSDLDQAKIVIHAVDDQGNPVQHEFNGIGVTFGVGHDYASADHAANASKEQRAIEGKRERRDGAAKPAPPRRFVQTTGRTETAGDRGRRADDIQGAEKPALASRVSKGNDSDDSVAVKGSSTDSTQAPPIAKETFRTAAARRVGDMAHDLLLKIAPMGDNRASDTARAVAKDFANIERMAQHEHMVADKAIADALSPDERKAAWKAANEQSELEQQGLPTKGKGLDTLEPRVRAIVEHEMERSKESLQAAVEAGMFDGENSLPSYVPRMIIRRLASGVAERFGKTPGATRGEGGNVRTSSPHLMARKHLLKEDTESAAKARDADAEVLEDIRTLPLATKRMWEAVNGRRLINAVRDTGSAIGEEYVKLGKNPDPKEWFTMDHPSFTEYKRRTEADPDNAGKLRNALDVNHEPIYDPAQLWIHKSFEGPLKAILTEPDGATYKFLMEAKTKAMTGIMISPAIHLMTEVGRALPAAPGKFLTGKIWSSGAATLRDAASMREALEHGLTPIGGRGGNTDATTLANEGHIEPGRSLIAKVIGNTVGLLSKDAGAKTKQGIDAAGKFWHETLLWDQIRKLQAGLYTHFRDEAVERGLPRADAARIGAHMANRFAGTLPKESMSNMAKKVANIAMFSRTFTLGNFGVMKDALTGLPKDVQAQILRDSGANGLNQAKSFARRAAIGAVILDTGLMYVSNALLQNVAAIYNGSTLEKELKGYATRFGDLMQHLEKNPLDALNVLGNINALTPQRDNEPGKQDRILVGHQEDGTAIYMRNPFGKIGEEFKGWFTSPVDMLKRKTSTFARPVVETLTNDKGFGRKLYDPNDSSMQNVYRVAANFFGDQFNTSLIQDTRKIIAGDKDAAISKLHLLGDMTGFTFSKGAPGGEAVGELYQHKSGQEFKVQEAMPAIRQKIQNGDVAGAVHDMSQLGVEPKLMEYYIKTTINPKLRLSPGQLRKFMESATPDERVRMQRSMTHSVDAVGQ